MTIQAIDVALSQLGVHEDTGKNDGIPAERYMRGDKLAWCAGFALFCNQVSDDENVATTTAEHYAMRSVTTFVEVMKRRGMFVHRNQPPQRNDFVFFGDTDSDVGVKGSHMGIVDDVDVEAGVFHSVEGNYGNAVQRVRHRLSDPTIIGYGRAV